MNLHAFTPEAREYLGIGRATTDDLREDRSDRPYR
jgi:hypothetical protein